MRFLSLFAGIGGIDAGLEAAGFECAGQVEIDPFCNLVLERHWPDVPRWLDVHDVSAESVRGRCGHIDLIAGGFPCQPHSFAGKRRGQSDDRYLWPEFARLIREIRPRWVLAENVPGIRSTAADEVVGDMEAFGYAIWPLVVGAEDVGAPHRRKRVWFVANSNDEDESSLSIDGKTRGSLPTFDLGNWWKTAEPELVGVVDGLPARMDRIRAIGNAVVPQVVYCIALAIDAVERRQA